MVGHTPDSAGNGPFLNWESRSNARGDMKWKGINSRMISRNNYCIAVYFRGFLFSWFS